MLAMTFEGGSRAVRALLWKVANETSRGKPINKSLLLAWTMEARLLGIEFNLQGASLEGFQAELDKLRELSEEGNRRDLKAIEDAKPKPVFTEDI